MILATLELKQMKVDEALEYFHQVVNLLEEYHPTEHIGISIALQSIPHLSYVNKLLYQRWY